MSRRMLLIGATLIVLAAGLGWLFSGAPAPWTGPGREGAAAAGEDGAGGSDRKIKATIYYGSPDGMRLVGVEREVTYAQSEAEQARQLVEALLQPPPSPYVPVVPPGTRLRALYISERGEAFVDLSREVSQNHPGGSLTELFTVYSIVNTLTATMPSIAAVQILVEGQEVDTIAGHVDVRHPLRPNAEWVEGPPAPQAAAR